MDAWAVAFGFTVLFGLDRAAVAFLAAGLDFAAALDFGFAAVFGFAVVLRFAVVLGLEAVFDVAVDFDFDFAAAFGFDLVAVDFAVEPFDDPCPVRVRGLLCPELLVAIIFPF